ARTVSIRRCPPESSSSSRSPSARSPSGPGLSALMNMEVMEHGPEISMPGVLKSAGTAGTFHSPAAAGCAGCEGRSPLARARGGVEGCGPPREQRLDPRGEPVMEREEIFEERGGEQLVGALHGRPAHAGRCRTCHEALLRLPRWRGLVPERRGASTFFRMA